MAAASRSAKPDRADRRAATTRVQVDRAAGARARRGRAGAGSFDMRISSTAM